MLRGQILLRIHVAPEIKCQRTSGDECVAATRPWNMSGQHVPSVCTGPCYILQQHGPKTCPGNMSPQCALDTILPLLHFAATCPRNLTRRMGSPYPAVKKFLSSSFCPHRYNVENKLWQTSPFSSYFSRKKLYGKCPLYFNSSEIMLPLSDWILQ